ncbi:MAG: hypothetical protein FWG50_05805 [Kiritimatiellaeota bacterium]|nr:hypothetical protein [Kiritimatiellota bacterium]
MPDSRKVGKKHIGAWLDETDIETLKRIAVLNDTDVTGLLRMIARREQVKVKENDNGKEVR